MPLSTDTAGMSEGEIIEATDPDAAFAALADDTRIAILRTLGGTDGYEATFSELREAVGMRDSGQFNYHLDKLRGQFLTKTDDGYRLTLAGVHVHGALLAGAYTKTGTLDPVSLDEPCPACGGVRTFRYDGEMARFECADCRVSSFFPVPPGVFAGYDTDEWPGVAERYFREYLRHADSGFCPVCDGRMDGRLADRLAQEDPEKDLPEDYREFPTFRYACERCEHGIAGDLGSGLLLRPPVVAFHHDNGVDVRDTPLSRFQTVGTDDAEIVSRDPLRVRLTYTAGGETLVLTVDDVLEIQETDRSDR